MKDQASIYALRQIYFYLTEACNLRCRHCWIAPKYQAQDKEYRALHIKVFQYIIEQAKPLGLSGVKLTGGEPFLHPAIQEILDFISSEDLQLSLETNGVLCTEELAKQVARCRNPFVAVSLDGADSTTHEWARGVAGCFEAAKEGVKNLVQAGLKPQIIMTIMRCNKDELESVVRMAESLGAGSVKFNILQPIARGKEMHEAGENLSINELVDVGRWVETSLSASTDIQLYYDHPVAFRPLGKMFSETGDGCGICNVLNILGVLADGTYSLCGIGTIEPDLVFGEASSSNLQEVWNNTVVLNELREAIPYCLEGICGRCLMRGICRGGCIAQNYYRRKNFLAPFWYCEQAAVQGFFPETRIAQ